MTALSVTPRAKADLAKIWAYTLKKWGEDQAFTYIRQVNRDMQAVARNLPGGGHAPISGPAYRRYPTGPYVIFY